MELSQDGWLSGHVEQDLMGVIVVCVSFFVYVYFQITGCNGGALESSVVKVVGGSTSKSAQCFACLCAWMG